MTSLVRKLERLEAISDKLENLADECYALDCVALGNKLIEGGYHIQLQMDSLKIMLE